MILEIANFTIKANDTKAFEHSFAKAQKECLSVAKGYVKHQLTKGIENPTNYQLLVYWQTLEDHTKGFRESEAFVRWRELIGPYFESAPVVYHFELV